MSSQIVMTSHRSTSKPHFCGKQYEHKRRTAFLFTPCALTGARGATGDSLPLVAELAKLGSGSSAGMTTNRNLRRSLTYCLPQKVINQRDTRFADENFVHKCFSLIIRNDLEICLYLFIFAEK